MGESATEFNLLTERLIRVRRAGEPQSVTLPELYQALMSDEVESVTALRPHQRHALHAILVQVGAMALLEAGTSELPQSADAWTEILRGLTPGFENDEPWCVVVQDLAKPAFLQPPVPEGTLAVLKETELTPDSLDMLVTAKNHDLKAARMTTAKPDCWLFALITLQTCEGFLGRGNYGISRMNGGFASRPFVGLAPPGQWGAHIRRDVVRLAELRADIVASYPIYREKAGLRLIWIEPWDGETQVTLDRLDPYYVEICRRIRLVQNEGTIIAHRGPSRNSRLATPEKLNGVTGDPWTPIDRKGSKAVTVDGSGFHYRRVVDLLDAAKFSPAPLQEAGEKDSREGLEISFSVIVRGQGETQGFHERRIPIPSRAVPFFMRGAATDRLAELARERVTDGAAMRGKVLTPALFCLFQNAPDKINYKHPATQTKADPLLSRFDREIDTDFFEHLFEELTEEKHSPGAREKRSAWLRRLKARADDVLAIAEAGSPLSQVRRYRSRAAAKSLLDGAFQRQFSNWLKGEV